MHECPTIFGIISKPSEVNVITCYSNITYIQHTIFFSFWSFSLNIFCDHGNVSIEWDGKNTFWHLLRKNRVQTVSTDPFRRFFCSVAGHFFLCSTIHTSKIALLRFNKHIRGTARIGIWHKYHGNSTVLLHRLFRSPLFCLPSLNLLNTERMLFQYFIAVYLSAIFMQHCRRKNADAFKFGLKNNAIGWNWKIEMDMKITLNEPKFLTEHAIRTENRDRRYG